MRILVVEDEPIAALSAMSELQRAGYEVLGPVKSPEEALRLARELHPHLALVDIDLDHGGEGLDVARTLRELDVVSVFMSAQTDVANANRNLALGMICKPYSAADLVYSVDVLEALLAGRPQKTALPNALRLFN